MAHYKLIPPFDRFQVKVERPIGVAPTQKSVLFFLYVYVEKGRRQLSAPRGFSLGSAFHRSWCEVAENVQNQLCGGGNNGHV
jgi:hypothetical protein